MLVYISRYLLKDYLTFVFQKTQLNILLEAKQCNAPYETKSHNDNGNLPPENIQAKIEENTRQYIQKLEEISTEIGERSKYTQQIILRCLQDVLNLSYQTCQK